MKQYKLTYNDPEEKTKTTVLNMLQKPKEHVVKKLKENNVWTNGEYQRDRSYKKKWKKNPGAEKHNNWKKNPLEGINRRLRKQKTE